MKDMQLEDMKPPTHKQPAKITSGVDKKAKRRTQNVSPAPSDGNMHRGKM